MTNLLFFGAAALAHYLREHLRTDKARIIAYAITPDARVDGKTPANIDGVPLLPLDEAAHLDWDYCIVATSQVAQAKRALISAGIPAEKTVAYMSSVRPTCYDHSLQKATSDLVHNFLNDALIPEFFTLGCKGHYLCAMNIAHDEAIIEGDYVREQTLALLAAEIKRKGVKGSVAELGVFRGDFARKINALFPDRSLYLFDTFEGFADVDIQDFDVAKGENYWQFQDTSVEAVLSRMPHADKCIVKKGHFPDTYDLDEDEQFALVSIDCDLYAPIYAGLETFYPKMTGGG